MPNTNLPSKLPKALLAVGSERFGIRAQGGSQNIETMFNQINSLLHDGFNARDQQIRNLSDAMSAIQNQINAGGHIVFGGSQPSWGDQVVNSELLTGLRNAAGKAKAQIDLTPTNAITSVPGSGGALIAPDRADAVAMPRRRLTIRDLLGRGTTGSNMIEYPRQVVREVNAATVAEMALKPESSFGWELAQAKVQTIAHWVGASRQVLDDGGQLRTLIDGELRYGLALLEEMQLLLGDGAGTNLLGLIPQATAYDATGEAANASKFDVVLNAIAQAERADLPATGIVVNSTDWLRLQGLKDSEGRYIGSGPMGTAMATAWGLDVAPSASMPAGKFLVGNFANSATVYDRMTPVVLLSTEDRENFVRNAVTILAEERIALAVRQPRALIYGDYSEAQG